MVEIQGKIIEKPRQVVRISGPVTFSSGQTVEDLGRIAGEEGKVSAEGTASGGQSGRARRRRWVHSRAATAANPPYSIHSHQACSACSL
jgi:hypothetical protein